MPLLVLVLGEGPPGVSLTSRNLLAVLDWTPYAEAR
jgi:hypothetical protein